MNTNLSRPGNNSRSSDRHEWGAALTGRSAQNAAASAPIRCETCDRPRRTGVDHLRNAFRVATDRFLAEHCVLTVADLLPENRQEYHAEILLPFQRLLASLERHD